jgi:hypothetical protein
VALKFSFRKVPIDSEGKAHDSLESFQASEIAKLFRDSADLRNQEVELNSAYAAAVVAHKAEIIEILELDMNARPSARGVSKKRKAKDQPELPKVT